MSQSIAEKFVDRVYRRLVICRMIEQVGVGLLLASALATILNLLGIWQSIPTAAILIASGSLGLLAATMLTLYRRPTRKWAAAEADRQLGFDDLLTSAIFCETSIRDDFSKTVHALADARCGQFSPSDVALWRLSARGWSGIGLAVSIAVILSAIPFTPAASQAVDTNLTVLSQNSFTAAEKLDGKIVRQTNDPSSESGWNEPLSSRQQIDPAAAAGGEGSTQNSRSVESTFGGAGGSALTNERGAIQNLQSAAGTQYASANGHPAGGGAASNSKSQIDDESLSQQSVTGRSPASVPTWHGGVSSNPFPNSMSLPNGPIPPQDRDLIRDFFSGR